MGRGRANAAAAAAGDVVDDVQLSNAEVIAFILAGQQAGPGLVDVLIKEYKKAKRSVAQKLREDPDDDDANWEPIGLPMTQEEVRVHYAGRPNFWTWNITTAAQLERLQADHKRWEEAAEAGEEEAAEGGKKKDQGGWQKEHALQLFHYRGVRMVDPDPDEGDLGEFELHLGDHVIIPASWLNLKGEVVPNQYIGRVTEIAYSITGRFMIAIQWLYRPIDTQLAHPVKAAKKDSGEEYEMQLPGRGEFPPWQLFMCGSSEDNSRYFHVFNLAQVDRPCRVFHVPPGVKDPSTVYPDFKPQEDYAYSQYTVQDYFTIEDIYEDYTPFSAKYLEVEKEQGLDGIRELLGPYDKQQQHAQFNRLMQLSRGKTKKKLNHPKHRVLNMMELFAGGGGLSYLAQRNEKVKMELRWANDFNLSTSVAYTANHPEALHTCTGLDSWIALCFLWKQWVDILVPGWEDMSELQVVRQLHAGRRYSRRHMPEGVGCSGGVDPSYDQPAVQAADRGERARGLMQAAVLAWDSSRSSSSSKQPVLPAALTERLSEQEQDELLQQARLRVEEMRQADPQRQAELRKLAQQIKAKASAKAAEEAEQPVPDFAAIEMALKGLAMKLPSQGASSSSSRGSDAELLLSRLLPKQQSQQQQKGRKRGKKQQSPEEAAAVEYERAREHQLGVVQEQLDRNKEQDLGKVLEVRDVRVRDCGPRLSKGSSKGQLEKSLDDFECWLEFEVLRQGADAGGWLWEHQALLLRDDAVAPMRSFLLRMMADKTIPLPGDVHVMTGGPPCQNVSGLNRHATQQEVLKDPKNRLVTAYLRLVEHLKPNYLLMEQVTEVFSKEAGIYARFAIMRMAQMGYQTRAGILTAGQYGAPQGRHRVIFWAALSGLEQLPPFPAATHRCNYARGLPKQTKYSKVGFLQKPGETEAEARARAFPPMLLGDVFGDLPPIGNFSETEALDYGSDPKSVWQAYLRRKPPTWQLPRGLRNVHAHAALEPWLTRDYSAEEALQALEDVDPAKILQAGQLVFCGGNGGAGSKKKAAAGSKPKQQQEEPKAAQKRKRQETAAEAEAAKADSKAAGLSRKQRIMQQMGLGVPSSKSNSAAAAAAAAAGGSATVTETATGAEEEDSAVNSEEEVDDVLADVEGGDAEEGAEGGGDDDDDEAAARAIAGEVKMAGKFAGQTLQAHMQEHAKKKAAAGLGSEQQLLDIMGAINIAQTFHIAQDLGVKRLKLTVEAGAAHEPLNVLTAPLRDHRPHMCNADDYLRCCAVPGEGKNFRDMPGVITHPDGTNCAGCWHAAAVVKPKVKGDTVDNAKILQANIQEWKKKSPAEKAALSKDLYGYLLRNVDLAPMHCAGGGMPMVPPKGLYSGNGNHKMHRVDFHGSRGKSFRGSHLGKCESCALFMATLDLVCPRWCVTYKKGKSNGRHGCFGRVNRRTVQSTVVTRAEPHNLQVVHHLEDRVLTIRENARCQGFPDYHVFAAVVGSKTGGGKGLQILAERYLQIGNAVSPPLATGLGGCLLLAAAEEAPVATPVVEVLDPAYMAIEAQAEAKGLTYYAVENDVPDIKVKAEPAAEAAESDGEAAAAAAAGGGEAAEEADAVATVAPRRKKAGKAAVRRQGSSTAAAVGGPSSGAAATAGEGSAAAGKPNGSKKRKQADSAAAAAADGADAAVAAAAAAGGHAKKARKVPQGPPAAAAAAGTDAPNGAAAAAGGGSRRTSRAAAANASRKITEQVQVDSSPLGKYAKRRQQQEKQLQALAAAVPAAAAAAAAAAAGSNGPAAAAAGAGAGSSRQASAAADSDSPPGSRGGEQQQQGESDVDMSDAADDDSSSDNGSSSDLGSEDDADVGPAAAAAAAAAAAEDGYLSAEEESGGGSDSEQGVVEEQMSFQSPAAAAATAAESDSEEESYPHQSSDGY